MVYNGNYFFKSLRMRFFLLFCLLCLAGSVCAGPVPQNRTKQNPVAVPGVPLGDQAQSKAYVILYEHANFRGKSQYVGKHVADLGVLMFDNRVSSIKLVNIPLVSLYAEKNFAGKCMPVSSDLANLNATFIGNDQVSSLKINHRCQRQHRVVFINKTAAFIHVYAQWVSGNGPLFDKRLRPAQSVAWHFPAQGSVKIMMDEERFSLTENRWGAWPLLDQKFLFLSKDWEITIKGFGELSYDIKYRH